MGAADRLHPGVLRWLHAQGWQSLREVQERAVAPILDGGRDVLISAPTAGGKTEAAFLPIVSSLAHEPPRGVGCLCVSPLRALISDQARRLEGLCESAGLRVQPWHSDVTAGKQQFWKSPAQILLITPESLEGMFLHRPAELARALAELRFVVVDELHALVGSVRGRQLQSLLRRVDALIGRSPPRVALSATFGDLAIAQRFLRPDGARPCDVIEGAQGGSELRVQVRALVRRKGVEDPYATIARDLYAALRGQSHLVFANARGLVELLADGLRERCEEEHVPNEFFAHHASLARDQRQWLEQRLREAALPTTAICTSTLELGIDLGDVTSVAQVGAAPTVAALKQRLGRSGRRPGKPQILRQYVVLGEVDADSPPAERLRLPLIQAIAAVELMLQKRFEPPALGEDLHFSTLVQQALSVIAQQRGERADRLYTLLCATGPFEGIAPAAFTTFLRGLGRSGVIEQLADGTLVPGAVGEQLLAGRDIYAAFAVPEEYRLLVNGRPLGTLPIDTPVTPGTLLIFGGRRWQILSADLATRTLILAPARSGRVPKFGGGPAVVSRLLRQGMQEVLRGTSVPIYLDACAQDELMAARGEFEAMGLDASAVYAEADRLWLAPWCSDRALNVLRLAFTAAGYEVEKDDAFIAVATTDPQGALDTLRTWIAAGVPSVDVLLDAVIPVAEQKFDDYVETSLRLLNYGVRHLDTREAQEVLASRPWRRPAMPQLTPAG